MIRTFMKTRTVKNAAGTTVTVRQSTAFPVQVSDEALARLGKIELQVTGVTNVDPTKAKFLLQVSESDPLNSIFGPITIVSAVEGATGISPSGTFTPSSLTAEFQPSGGSTQEYEVTRPVQGSPPGLLTLTAVGANRHNKSISVDVPASTIEQAEVETIAEDIATDVGVDVLAAAQAEDAILEGAITTAYEAADTALESDITDAFEAGDDAVEAAIIVPPPSVGLADPDIDGEVPYFVRGGSNTQSLKIVFSTSGAPSLATVQAGTPVNAAFVNDLYTASPRALGQDLWIGVLGYSATSGGGTESPLVVKQVTRQDASASKSIKIPAWAFRRAPGYTDSQWGILGSGIKVAVSDSVVLHYGRSFPVGSVITAMRARLKFASGGLSKVFFFRKNGDETTTEVCNVEASNSGWDTYEVTGLSETVGADPYVFTCPMISDGNDGAVAMLWVEIVLTAPSVIVND